MNRSDVARALRVAASPAFRSLLETRMKVPCCDCFSYSVSVNHSDGTSRRFTTSERRAAPLASLLGLIG